jgi:hypothetical protein
MFVLVSAHLDIYRNSREPRLDADCARAPGLLRRKITARWFRAPTESWLLESFQAEPYANFTIIWATGYQNKCTRCQDRCIECNDCSSHTSLWVMVHEYLDRMRSTREKKKTNFGIINHFESFDNKYPRFIIVLPMSQIYFLILFLIHDSFIRGIIM